MSPAMPLSPGRWLAALPMAFLVVAGVVLALGTSPAQAAKPCWERVIDDWVDNDRIDGVYSAKCLQEAVKHLPEDVRAYSNFEDQVRQLRQDSNRLPQGSEGAGGSGGGSGSGSGGPAVREIEPNTGPREEGPIQSVLGSGTTDATSIPLPLIILAALALLLLAAGAAGLVSRKLQARRAARTSTR